MDRTRRPVMETRTIEDHRRAIVTETHETSLDLGAPGGERVTSGILRELAEQMRHWD